MGCIKLIASTAVVIFHEKIVIPETIELISARWHNIHINGETKDKGNTTRKLGE